MRMRAVIGANFGDEGKGLVTDYLASKGGDVVVRFNGGCQAGHTVVAPEGHRHVFSHFGAGSFVGLPTFFSQHTIVNPVLFIKEYEKLQKHITAPVVYIHPDALVTTPWDMNANQMLEKARNNAKHGSCGVGIFQTIVRNRKVPLRMRDLWDNDLTDQLADIIKHYSCGTEEENENMRENFLRDCEWFAHVVRSADITQFIDPIFEGAQGLLLDQGNMEMYPHLTPSRCGMHNVRELMWEMGCDVGDVYYVSRPYLTRHGAGSLPGYDPEMEYEDDTNVKNDWQGWLRFGHLMFDELERRIHADHDKPKLVYTHCDQASAPTNGAFYSFGPTRNDVYTGAQPLRRKDVLRDRSNTVLRGM